MSSAAETGFETGDIQVVVASDDGYARHLSVMLLSLFEHDTAGKVRVHVIVPEHFSERARLNEALGDNASRLTYRVVTQDHYPDPGFPSHMRTPTWFRCVIGSLLPRSIERVIYLDCDMIVRRDLRELWETPLGDHPAAAVRDAQFTKWHILGLPRQAGCYNTGLMLVDMARWREAAVGEAAFDFGLNHPERLTSFDQCALNIVLQGRWLELDARWNAQFGHFSDEWKGGRGYLRPLSAVAAEAWIVHFNGPGKPWQYMDSHPFKPEYLAYKARTPWREETPRDRNILNMMLKPFRPYASRRVREIYWRVREYI